MEDEKKKEEEIRAGRDARTPSRGPRGWHDRWYLPHYDGEVAQFVTVHLGDAMPKEVIDRWASEIVEMPRDERNEEMFKRRQRYIDQGHGECFLRIEAIAELVRKAFLRLGETHFDLKAWVIMPNHFHIAFRQKPGVLLEKIMHSIKSFTAQEANKLLGRQGKFWQEEYFDRYIRDGRHFAAVVRYIEMNPVKAGLCQRPEDWKYSSAYGRASD